MIMARPPNSGKLAPFYKHDVLMYSSQLLRTKLFVDDGDDASKEYKPYFELNIYWILRL
jgi:hypothetical protein